MIVVGSVNYFQNILSGFALLHLPSCGSLYLGMPFLPPRSCSTWPRYKVVFSGEPSLHLLPQMSQLLLSHDCNTILCFVLLYMTVFYHSFFFLEGGVLIYLFIYLFLAVLGLRFCARAFSSCGKRGPLFIAVHRPFTVVASLVAGHRLQTRRLSSCGSRA